MSHDGIWRAACLNRDWILILHSETRHVARGVTDVGVGSGALLALSAIEKILPPITRLRSTLQYGIPLYQESPHVTGEE